MKGTSFFATIGLVAVIIQFVTEIYILKLMNAFIILICVIGVASLDIKERRMQSYAKEKIK